MTASGPGPTGDDVLKLVEEAAAVERELCAKVADAAADRARSFKGNQTEALTAEAIAAQIRARGPQMKENGSAAGLVKPNKLRQVQMHVDLIVETIEAVDQRCMAVDGPVIPTRQEITDDEMVDIWDAACCAERLLAELRDEQAM